MDPEPPTCAGSKFSDELYRRSIRSTESVRKGKGIGPFRAEEVPHDAFASSLRSMAEAEGKKPRECDDAERSLVNDTAGLLEGIRMPGFAGVLSPIHVLMFAFPATALLMATEDFDQAFTQLPLAEDQRRFSYYHVRHPDGHTVFFCHLSGWFGPRLMPFAWCRIMELVLLVLRRRFNIPCICHMDDLILIIPSITKNLAPLALTIAKSVCRWLGLTHPPKTERLPARLQQALGGQITLPLAGELTAAAQLPPDKAAKYVRHRISDWATQDILPASTATAAKVAGYAQVLDSAHFGRVAQAYLWPVYHRANSTDTFDDMTPCLRFSLLAIARFIKDSQPRIIRPLVTRPVFRL